MRCDIETTGIGTSTGARTLLGVLAAGCLPITGAVSGEPERADAVKLSYAVQAITQAVLQPSDTGCPVKVLIAGAGQTNLLGPIHDEQSHCVQADGTIDQGIATFTGATLTGPLPGGGDSGDSISGQYRAHAVPTFASVISNPPGGYWLGYGEFCICKGTGKFAAVINDCPTPTSPGRFFPARITQDFNTGQVSVFGVAIVRFHDAD